MTSSIAIFSALLIGAVVKTPKIVETAFRRLPYVGAIAVEADSGSVLTAANADKVCYPASCTKLMTARLALRAIAEGRLKLSDRLAQSEVSYREKPSWLGIKPGVTISVEDGLKAMMVHSANDVAVMFAERLGGSVAAFVDQMNLEARALAMTNTVFVSPNGYPPPRGSKRGFDRSSAADLAKLAKALLAEQPEILHYTSLKRITIPEVKNAKGELLQMVNHNDLLVGRSQLKIAAMGEVDGLKTGYHDAGGSSIIVTGKRNGKRVIVVVVGSATRLARDESATQLLFDALGAVAW